MRGTMVAIAALLLLGGCNAIFGLEPAQRGDAGADADAGLADPDEDGVPDATDNCPGRADVCDRFPALGGDRLATGNTSGFAAGGVALFAQITDLRIRPVSVYTRDSL